MWPISGHQKLISGDQNSIWVGKKWMCVFLVARSGHVANHRQKLLATRILLRVARNGCLYFWWPEMDMLLISGHQKSITGTIILLG